MLCCRTFGRFSMWSRASVIISQRGYAPRDRRSNRFDTMDTRKSGMAGIRRQTDLLQDIGDILDDPEEGYSKYESDFMNLHKTYDDYENELTRNSHKVKQSIIKRKYFKEKGINFLTWSEKELIRKLYNDDSDEWPVERIAESFPVTIGTAVKIVKAKWFPNSAKRIQSHDEAVKKHWQQFKNNELPDLEPDFVNHLKKFSHRQFDNTDNSAALKMYKAQKFELPKPKSNEFSSIITDCKGYRGSQTQLSDGKSGKMPAIAAQKKASDTNALNTAPDDDTYCLRPIQNKQPYQFDGITKTKSFIRQNKRHETPVDPDLNFNENDGAIVLKQEDFPMQETKSEEVTEQSTPIEAPKQISKYENRSIQFQSSSFLEPMDQVDIIKHQIRIPRNLYKKGATYQFKDCFYHSNGELIYRVPGMMPKNYN